MNTALAFRRGTVSGRIVEGWGHSYCLFGTDGTLGNRLHRLCLEPALV